MASFPKKVEDSFGQLPPIQFGQLNPNVLRQILENEDSGKSKQSQPLPSGPLPLSPQLMYSRAPKPPRIPRQLSRMVSPLPPPPPNLTPTTGRYYVGVPSQWCIDSRVGSRATYLSRNPFLRKMYPRRLLCRRFKRIQVNNKDKLIILEMQILGYPVDFWLSFPLKPPNRPECSKPPLLGGLSQNPDQEMAYAWATGPDRCSMDTLDRVVDQGPEPVDGMKFPWLTTTSSTKIATLQNMLSLGVKKISGYLKCPKCNVITGLSYLLPGRFGVVLLMLEKFGTELWYNGEEVLRQCTISCLECSVEVRPVISEDLEKINWLFLFLGCSLGYCTKDQLRYFCGQRKLGTSGSKNSLLYRVCENICDQLQPDISFPPQSFLETV